MRFYNNVAYCLIAALLTFVPLSPAMADSANDVAKRLNAEWNAAFNNDNAAGVAALYAEDAVLSPGNGKTLKGRDEIQQLFQDFIDNGVHGHSIEIVEARQVGDVLYEVAHWQAHGTAEDGSQTTFGGILTNTFERNDEGDWKSRAHVWNVK